MVEALGTAPKSSMCVESYQRLRLIYNTSSHLCQGIFTQKLYKTSSRKHCAAYSSCNAYASISQGCFM